MSTNALANIEKAKTLIEKAKTIDKALFIKGLLKEEEIQARKKGLVDIQVLAANYQVLVMQKIGQILLEMKAGGELARGGQPFQKRNVHGGNPNPRPNTREVRHAKHSTDQSKKTTSRKSKVGTKISELGLSRDESSEAQRLAKKSPEEIESIAKEREQKIRERATRKAAEKINQKSKVDQERIQERAEEIAGNAVLQAVKEIDLEDMNEQISSLRGTSKFTIPLPEGQFNVLYADPPWEYEFQQSANRRIEMHYPTMKLEELKAMPVQQHIAQDSILFMWSPAPKLLDALEIMNA